MRKITLFTRADCTLCRAAAFVINRVRGRVDFDFERVDITDPGNEEWLETYRNDIPVVHLDGREIFRHRVDERRLRSLLSGE